jgi:predicted ATPase
VIEAAAVVGKEFGRAAVEHLVADVDVEEQLMTLTKRELVRPDREGRGKDQAYRFRHVLIRDAAYDAIPKQARADLHERLGDWMQATTGERFGEVEEIVGYHLERAYRYRLVTPRSVDRVLGLQRRRGGRTQGSEAAYGWHPGVLGA